MADHDDNGAQINRLRERVARLEAKMDAADKALELKERNIAAQARAQAGIVAAVVASLISLAASLITSGFFKGH
jgi:hypothetical protein